MFADSDFTEDNTQFSNHGEEFMGNTILRAAPGQEWSGKNGEVGKVRWRPAAGSINALSILSGGTNVGVELYGIEFDGTDETGSPNAGLVFSAAALVNISRCSFHHNPQGYGFSFNTSALGRQRMTLCLFNNNSLDGMRRLQDNLSRGMQFEYCGFYKNDGFGARGSAASSSVNFEFRHCWFVTNGSGSWEDAGGNGITGWCSTTDALATPAAQVMIGMLENQTEAGMLFVDAPGGDFKIQAGSTLLEKGQPRNVTMLSKLSPTTEDVTGAALVFSSASSRYDIGPHQFSLAAVDITSAPIIS